MILQALTAKNNVLFCGLNQSVCCHKTTVKLLPQASDDYIPYLITALQYLMSMGIYNLPRGKKKKKGRKTTCARLLFIETCNVQTENRNANTAAAVEPTGLEK